MNEQNNMRNIDLQALERILGSSLIWVGIAFLTIMVFAFKTIRIERVSGEEVGFLLNKINGDIEVINRSGSQIYNGLTKEFYVLDKTLQAIEMTADTSRGDRMVKDDLKVKTKDGSDVYVDLKIQYRMNIDMADEVIATSGPLDNYKQKWARDYVRAITRTYLGELITEEFYDASKRDGKLNLAQKELNDRLGKFGIIIDSIAIPRRPRFYQAYEDMIKQKKLADQAVLEEQSKALAAKQKQLTLIVQETNKKNVAVEQYEGIMTQKVIAAEAQAVRGQKAADAYFQKVTITAEARLYEMQKNATATLASKSAEAAGIMALKKALEGKGGRNMVKLEYAKKLKDITITGKPFTIDGSVERFEHLKAGAASQGR